MAYIVTTYATKEFEPKYLKAYLGKGKKQSTLEKYAYLKKLLLLTYLEVNMRKKPIIQKVMLPHGYVIITLLCLRLLRK